MPSTLNGGEYMDVLTFKKTATGKIRATLLGSARQNDDGSINVYLDALPMPTTEGCRLVIKKREPKPQPRAVPAQSRRGVMDDDISDIPF